MDNTASLIMEMTERELRAVLLQLAGGSAGRAVADAAVTEISATLTMTRS